MMPQRSPWRNWRMTSPFRSLGLRRMFFPGFCGPSTSRNRDGAAAVGFREHDVRVCRPQQPDTAMAPQSWLLSHELAA